MDPIWLVLLLPVAAGSGWLAARYRNVPRGKVGSGLPAPAAYFKSLNFLLTEQHDKALDVLVQALEQHDEDLEIQLALGGLFRRRGEIERATQLHQGLIARAGLSAEQRGQVLFELANDYYKAGLLDRSENLLLEAAGRKELLEPSLHLLVQIYESEKEWKSAIGVAGRLDKLTGGDLRVVIAQYHCELAEREVSAGNYPFAQTEVADALALDRSCARARILEGRLQALSGNHRDAVGSWSGLGGEHPEMLCEVVHLVKASSSALGSLSLFRGFLDQAIAATGDERLKLILVDHLAASGSEREAEKVLLKLVNETASLPGLHRLLQFRALDTADSRIRADYQLLRHVTGKLLSDRPGYECRFCGFQGRSLHWQCPGCRSWNTTSARPFKAILN